MLVCAISVLVAREAGAAASSPPQTPVASNADELLNLAEKAGFKKLTDCEQKLLEAVPIGAFAYCQSTNDEENDPSKGDKWPEPRQIDGWLIRWLCVDDAARKLIDPEGIQIYGAKAIDPPDLDYISVPFRIDIEHSRILGPMSLIEANIEALNLNGTWTGPITADRLTTRGPIFLSDSFHADGEVRLLGATVGGNLESEKGTFSNPKGYALSADGIKVAGGLLLKEGFNATGEVRLNGAAIGGPLECIGATFTPGSWMNVERARIAGEFWWTRISDGTKNSKPYHKNPDVWLDLTGASAASVTDDEDSWPVPGKLFLNGFTYNHFELATDTGAAVPHDADSRLRWLRLQDRSTGLATESYEQLATVLEKSGDERGARQVRIAMEDDLRGNLLWYRQIWPWLLKWTIGYGYEPWIALWWALGFVIVGYLSFALGYRAGVIGPTDKEAFRDFQAGRLSPGYQRFNAFTYSLDTFLPIINLGLKDKWMPDAIYNPNPKALEGTWLGDFVGHRRWLNWLTRRRFFNSGRALRVYFWCHLLLGWVLITLVVAGFTGIIRR